ncbi:putative baseplate assembly protein [Spirulina subsalsa]|nr:putative baseplate assembly protein [Spirulina subsalsa]
MKMSLDPPKLDQRSREEIIQETLTLVESYSDWQIPGTDAPDLGLALVRIFGHMMTVVQNHLNDVPNRNQLAFLNLIGTELVPPQAARVPVTFRLTPGGSGVLIPPQTQVAAPPTTGEDEDVVFETEQELLVTDTQLRSIFVIEDHDYYSQRNPETQGEDLPFCPWHGDRPVDHYLYWQAGDLFDLPELTQVTVTLETDSPASAEQLAGRLADWEAWDGQQWQGLSGIERSWSPESEQVFVTLSLLPKLQEVEVDGVSGKWLRVRLTHYQREQLPELRTMMVSTAVDQRKSPQACFFNTSLLDLSKDFYPFGTAPQFNDTFRIALDARLIQPGMVMEVEAEMSRSPRYTDDLAVVWEVGQGVQWQEIETTDEVTKFRWLPDSGPLRFVAGSVVGVFQFPSVLPGSGTGGEATYWLRARIVGGQYGSRGGTRPYVVYNEVTMVAQTIPSGQLEIEGDDLEGIALGDTLRLQSLVDPLRQEEAKVVDLRPEQQMIVLNHPTRHAYESGSRVLRKLTLTESTPDTFDPPILQSFRLTYRFILQRPARVKAYNDFIFCDATPLDLLLQRPVHRGERVVQFKEVSFLALGELLVFPGQPPEKRQIELIDQGGQQVILRDPLEQDYPGGTRVARCFHPLTPQLNSDSALYLGFNRPFPNRANSLYFQVQPPHPQEVAPGQRPDSLAHNSLRIVWEYPSPQGWQPLVVQDQTRSFSEKGLVQFIGPTDWIESPHFGQSRYWLRVRQQLTPPGDLPWPLLALFRWAITYQQFRFWGLMRYFCGQVARSSDLTPAPRIQAVRTNTTWASQSIHLRGEVLGSSNHEPNQVFRTSQVPILWGQQLEVQEGQMPSSSEQQALNRLWGSDAIKPSWDENGRLERVWVRWQEVPDFYSSSPSDRHYVIDRQLGTIRFGDGQGGRIPPRGRQNIRLAHYSIGGGVRGNQGTQTIATLKTTIPYLDGVINWEGALGGSDRESVERLKLRSPKHLRHRDRAVTAQDFADLTYEASIEVARVQVITPEMLAPGFNPLLEELWIDPNPNPQTPIPGNEIDVFNHPIRAGHVDVIIVPHSPDPQPTPNLALLNRVEQFLKARSIPTLHLHLSGPKWQEIQIITEIVPQNLANAGALKAAVIKRLEEFLHPLTGGQEGTGWQFGRRPQPSDIYAVLEAIPELGYVYSLEIQPTQTLIDQQTLIYSGAHQVILKEGIGNRE